MLGLDSEPATINQRPVFVARIDGHVVATGAVAAADGLITAIRIVLNPEKLGAFAEGPRLAI